MSSSEWARLRLILKREVPFGTVGGLIAPTSMSCSFSLFAIFTVS